VALRIAIGMAATVIGFALAGRRLWWLVRLLRVGQPAADRVGAARAVGRKGSSAQAVEVVGQRK
jgi:hypothetical protein